MREVLPNGTLSANERKGEFAQPFSAVSRRVRYENRAGRYALNAIFRVLPKRGPL